MNYKEKYECQTKLKLTFPHLPALDIRVDRIISGEPEVEGEITLGTPEDFATYYLSDVLATFRLNHPRVQLKVHCDLTLNLMERFRQGDFDIILVKRDTGKIQGGTQIWREPLIWVTGENYKYTDCLSLVLSPEPMHL